MNTNIPLSIVIPAYNEKMYIRQCLDSIVIQNNSCIEIIVIDDCSTDGTGGILDEYSDKYDFICVIHNEKQIGQGQCRNLGMSRSTSEYIVFVDADDYLDSVAIPHIREVISTTKPDLLVINYHLLYQNDVIAESGKRSLLEANHNSETDFKRMQLLYMPPYPWNKVYKKSYLEKNNIRFPEGGYEDISFSYRALLSASSIAVIEYPLYYYRQRSGTVVGKPNRKTRNINQNDIFVRYDDVYSELSMCKYGKEIESILYIIMLQHFSGALYVRLPNEATSRESFFTKMQEYACKYDPGVYVYPTLRARLNHYLVRNGHLYALILINDLYTGVLSLFRKT